MFSRVVVAALARVHAPNIASNASDKNDMLLKTDLKRIISSPGVRCSYVEICTRNVDEHLSRHLCRVPKAARLQGPALFGCIAVCCLYEFFDQPVKEFVQIA